MSSSRTLARRAVRTVLYSGLRPRIGGVVARVHNHLYNVSTDARTNGELWLVEQFPESGTFLDVGFNEGAWSRWVLERGSRRTVHAFDPARSVIEQQETFAPPGDFHFHPLALASAEGRLTFHEYGTRNGSSSLADRQAELGDGLSYEVETTTIDAWAARAGVTEVEVLKIDAEGFDLDIMEGARGLLESEAVNLVVFEYASGWFSANRTLMEATEFVRSVGYDLYRLMPGFLAPYRYRVQHEGAAMTGYFVALSPSAPIARRIAVRELSF